MVANVNFDKNIVGTPVLDSAGDTVTFSFTIEHQGGENITRMEFADALLGLDTDDILTAISSGEVVLGGDDGDNVFEAGEIWTFTEAATSDIFTYTLTQADLDSNGTAEPVLPIFQSPGQIDNVATLRTFNAADALQSVSIETEAAVLTIRPAISILKETNGTNDVCPDVLVGSTVTWTYTVTNPGNVAIENVVVSDDNGTPLNPVDDFHPTFVGGDTANIGVLDVGETWTYTFDGVAQLGEYENIATVNGAFVAPGANTPVSDSEEDCYTGLEANIHIVKTTNGTNDVCPDVLVGSTVTWGYTVTTTGDFAIENVVVSDDNGTPLNPVDDFHPTFVGGDTANIGVLDVGETWTYTFDGVAQLGEYENIATVNGTAEDESGNTAPVSDSEEDCYTGLEANIHIVKTTNGTNDVCPDVLVGSTVTWGYTVTTTGDFAIENVVVSDDNGTPLNPVDDFHPTFVGGDTANIGVLDVGETWTYTFDGVAQLGEYENIATVNGTAEDESGNTAPVSDSEEDCYTGIEPPHEEPGVRTPGFWQNPNNGGQFWDGIVGNEDHAGEPGFPDGELLYVVDSNCDGVLDPGTPGLLIGDYNFNGLTDPATPGSPAEDTLFISLADAQALVGSGGGSDGVEKLGRDVVATWLNYLAGNDIDNPGTGDDLVNPQHFINDAVDWLQVYGDASPLNINNPLEDCDVYSADHTAVKSSSAAWNQDGFLDHSASEIHSALDQYNNTGSIGLINYAPDAL